MVRRASLGLVVVGLALLLMVIVGSPLSAVTVARRDVQLNVSSTDPHWTVIVGGGGLDVTFRDFSSGALGDGWAVGYTNDYYGVLMHVGDGIGRQVTVLTDTRWINAIKMISATDGWAIDDKDLWRFNGLNWQKLEPWTPDSGAYNDIDIKGNTGWIVGEYNNYALRFDGSSWTPYTTPLYIAKSISIVNANDVWAVGHGYDVAHFSGRDWSPVTPDWNLPAGHYPRLRSVKMLDATEGWAAGYTTVAGVPTQCLLIHYTTGSWSRVPCPADSILLLGIAIRASNDAWAVGSRMDNYSKGVILHYDGSTWTSQPLPASTPLLFSIELIGANDGWIAGAAGTLLRLVNGSWTRVNGSNQFVEPIDAVSANEVWYGDEEGKLHQWRAGATMIYTTPFSTRLSALDVISPTAGWVDTELKPYTSNFAVGRFSSGSWLTWTVPQYIEAISAIGPDEAWIVPGAWHIVSGTLEAQSLPIGFAGTDSISMLDSAHGWATADYKVYTYTAGTWLEVNPALGTNEYPTKVKGIGPNEAWVIGSAQTCAMLPCSTITTVSHFTSGAWITTTLPNWQSLYDISLVGASEWWAAGRLKTMEHAFLHYKDGSYTTVPSAGEDMKLVSMLPDGAGFAAGVGSLLWYKSFPYQVYLPLIWR